MADLLQYIPLFKDAVLAIAAVVGTYVALRGLSTWNRQLKGAIEYDLTRRILKCTYRLREAIKGVRNPVIWAHEMPMPSEKEAAAMSKAQQKHYGLSSAYQKRWDKVTEVRADLQTEMLEAEALWGRVVYDKFEPLFRLQQELSVAVHAYVSTCDPNATLESRAAYQDILQKQRDILYELSSESCGYTQDVTSAIKDIELFLKIHLRK